MQNTKIRNAIYELLTQFKCEIDYVSQKGEKNSPWFCAGIYSKYAPNFTEREFVERGYFHLYQAIKNFLLNAEREEIALGGPGGN
jgi:hypothetical protein